MKSKQTGNGPPPAPEKQIGNHRGGGGTGQRGNGDPHASFETVKGGGGRGGNPQDSANVTGAQGIGGRSYQGGDTQSQGTENTAPTSGGNR